MTRSYMQEPFMRELADTFRATKSRIAQRVADSPSEMDAIVDDELRGLYHGLFVLLDGGTSLADEGLIRIIDEDGEPFERFLHETCFSYWPKDGG